MENTDLIIKMIDEIKENQRIQNSKLDELNEKIGRVYKNMKPLEESIYSHGSRLDFMENNSKSCKESCKRDIESLNTKLVAVESDLTILRLIQKYPKISLIIMISLILMFFKYEIAEIIKLIPFK